MTARHDDEVGSMADNRNSRLGDGRRVPVAIWCLSFLLLYYAGTSKYASRFKIQSEPGGIAQWLVSQGTSRVTSGFRYVL